MITSGHFLDDGFYYQGLIAERHADLDRALTSYGASAGRGERTCCHAARATILRTHGEAAESDDLLDQLLTEEPLSAPDILAARADLDNQAAMAQVRPGSLPPRSPSFRTARSCTMRAPLFWMSAARWTALRELGSVLKGRPDDPRHRTSLAIPLLTMPAIVPRPQVD